MAERADRLRPLLAEVCRRAYARGLIAGCSGNASVRAAEGFLVTPTGACLGDVEPGDLVLVDGDGRNVASVAPAAMGVGVPCPTSELPLHLSLYAALPDIGAILHTHSTAATALAVVGRDLHPPTTEAEFFLGRVPCVPFAPPGSTALAAAVAAAVTVSAGVSVGAAAAGPAGEPWGKPGEGLAPTAMPAPMTAPTAGSAPTAATAPGAPGFAPRVGLRPKALLLARHGVVVWGATVRDAFFQAELVEEAARVTFYLGR